MTEKYNAKIPHNRLREQNGHNRRGIFLTLFINMFLGVIRGEF